MGVNFTTFLAALAFLPLGDFGFGLGLRADSFRGLYSHGHAPWNVEFGMGRLRSTTTYSTISYLSMTPRPEVANVIRPEDSRHSTPDVSALKSVPPKLSNSVPSAGRLNLTPAVIPGADKLLNEMNGDPALFL